MAHFLFYWRRFGLIADGFKDPRFESGIYTQLKENKVKRGDLRMLLSNKTRMLKYINGIVIGMPIWFVVGILITFSPEFEKRLALRPH